MNKKIRALIVHGVLCIVALVFLWSGYLLEDPDVQRRGLLLMFSFIFIIILTSVYFIRNNSKMRIVLLIFMAIDLIVIDFYSKYAINYLYHVLYFIIVVAIVLYCKKKTGIILAIGIALASFIKFIQLIYTLPTQNSIVTFVFYSIIQILLITMVFTVKAYYGESQKTKNLYGELLDAYHQLDIYSRDIELLSAKQERSSIARDLHDTLGHDLTGLIMQLELADFNLEINKELGKKYLSESIDGARNSLTKVRAIVDTLKNQEKLVFVNQSLLELTKEYQKRTGINILLNVNNEETISPDYLIILYWVIQEALTNVAKHGNSDEVSINIKKSENNIEFSIKDYSSKSSVNKIGKPQKITKGNGLKGIEERLITINGSVEFIKYTGAQKGFQINGNIPINGNIQKRMEKHD